MVEMYYILLHLGQSAQIREIQMYYFLLLFKAGDKGPNEHPRIRNTRRLQKSIQQN